MEVFNTGLTSLDLLKAKYFKSKYYLENKYNLNLKSLIFQHSVTWQIKDAKRQIKETIISLNKLKLPTVVIYPCSDPGFDSIIKIYK